AALREAEGAVFTRKRAEYWSLLPDGLIRHTALASGKELARFDVLSHARRKSSLCFAADGKEVLTGGKDGYVYRWNSRTGNLIERVEVAPKCSITLVWLSTGGMWLCRGESNTEHPLTGRRYTVHRILFDPRSGKEVRRVTRRERHPYFRAKDEASVVA